MAKGLAITTIGAATALVACNGAMAGNDGQYRSSSYGYGSQMRIGSGIAATEDRQIGPVERLAIDGPVDVIVRQGATPSLTLTADDNIIDLVRVRNEGGTLSLATTGSFRTRMGITAWQ